METLRFLMVTTFYPPYHLGGDAVHVQYLAKALAERGHEVHVEFSPAAYRLKGGSRTAVQREDGDVALHPIPSPYGRMQPIASYLLGRSKSITRFHDRLIRNISPDVVHFHNISLLGLGVLGRAHAARTLYTAHDYWIRCPRSDLFKYGRFPCDAPTCVRCGMVTLRPPQLWRFGRAGKGLDGIDYTIAPSAFMKRAIEEKLAGSVVEIPNLAPDANPAGRISEPDDYYLFVGVHETHKGLLELASVAARSHDGPFFIFVGRGSLENRLRRLSERGQIRGEVKGWLEPAELAPLYRGARGLILPSLSHENSPLAAIEALSWGVPLLVSRRGGLEELLRDGQAGVSFEPRSDDILTAMEQFEEGPQTESRHRARLAYETFHHPAKYLERYMPLIDGQGEDPRRRESKEPVPMGRLGSAHA